MILWMHPWLTSFTSKWSCMMMWWTIKVPTCSGSSWHLRRQLCLSNIIIAFFATICPFWGIFFYSSHFISTHRHICESFGIMCHCDILFSWNGPFGHFMSKNCHNISLIYNTFFSWSITLHNHLSCIWSHSIKLIQSHSFNHTHTHSVVYKIRMK